VGCRRQRAADDESSISSSTTTAERASAERTRIPAVPKRPAEAGSKAIEAKGEEETEENVEDNFDVSADEEDDAIEDDDSVEEENEVDEDEDEMQEDNLAADRNDGMHGATRQSEASTSRTARICLIQSTGTVSFNHVVQEYEPGTSVATSEEVDGYSATPRPNANARVHKLIPCKMKMYLKITGICSNAVKSAFKLSGFRRTQGDGTTVA